LVCQDLNEIQDAGPSHTVGTAGVVLNDEESMPLCSIQQFPDRRTTCARVIAGTHQELLLSMASPRSPLVAK